MRDDDEPPVRDDDATDDHDEAKAIIDADEHADRIFGDAVARNTGLLDAATELDEGADL
jgi:hypothetical protein